MTNRIFTWVSAAVILVGSSAVNARGVDLSINDDSLRLTYFASANPVIPMSNAGMDAGLLYVEQNNEDIFMGHVGVGVSGDAGATRANVLAGLGGRLIALDANRVEGLALAIGGSVNVRIPEYQRIGFGGELYYAPDVSSFMDLDEYFEFSASVDYQLLRDAYAYVGYRQVKVGIDVGGNATVDNGAILGFRIRF